MVVNHKGRAFTQRNEPKLSLVEIELPKEVFLEGWEPTGSSYMGNITFLLYFTCRENLFLESIPSFLIFEVILWIS